nr:hypothetical protein [Tanacetum cinerariifolium]
MMFSRFALRVEDRSDENKGVSSEEASITSIPKMGHQLQGVANKPIPKVIFKSPIPVKECILRLANIETWDNIVKKFQMRTPERCTDKSKGKIKTATKTEKSNLLSPLLSKPESFSFTHCCSRVMENQSDVQNHLVEIQADDHDLLVNSDNENKDRLGYEFEKYSDDEDADGTNHAKDASSSFNYFS